MDIYKINKLMSNPTKARIIVHFVTCRCDNYSVSCLAKKLCAKQANISKHLANLRNKNIITYARNKHKVFYFINKQWLAKYASLMKVLINEKENQKFICKCNNGKLANEGKKDAPPPPKNK